MVTEAGKEVIYVYTSPIPTDRFTVVRLHNEFNHVGCGYLLNSKEEED